MKRIALSLIIAIVISGFTLWLMESPIKYFLFAFEIILISALEWIFVSPQPRIPRSVIKKQDVCRSAQLQVSRLDCLFVFLSTSLLLTNILGVFSQASILLAFVAVSLIPGYVLLRLTNISNSVSYLETFILSYALSLILSSTVATLFAPIATQSHKLLFLGLLTFLSTLPILKDLAAKRTISEQKMKRLEFSRIQFLAFAVAVGFFSVVIMSLYPQASFIPGYDIVGNFSRARLWGLLPEFLPQLYPLFHVYESALYWISTPPLEVYQTFLAITGISVLLSFYMMAKQYLDEIDTRLPVVATLFWTMFSGFGWVYLLQMKIEQPSTTQLDLLRMSYDATYADIGYSLSANLWLFGFIAMTASFTIFFALLYLLKNRSIPKVTFMFLISILVMGLYFIHASELVMFTVFILILELLGQKKDLRLNETLSSTFIGLVGTVIASYFMFGRLMQDYVTYLLITIVGLACLLDLLKWKGLDHRRSSQITKILASALTILFIAGLLSWLSLGATFSMNSVGVSFLVPWFFYPVRLGIVGLLGLLGIFVIAKKHEDKAVFIFPLLFFVSWITGRLVSFVNVNIFYTGYWEWRFLFVSFAATAITSTLALKHVTLERIMPKKSLGRICLGSFLVGILVLGGVSSTFLSIDNAMFQIGEKNLLDKSERDAISFLSSAFVREKPSPIFTVTSQSGGTLGFVPTPWVEKDIQPIIWSPKSSEIPLTFMYNMKFPPPYIYLHQRDLSAIGSSKMQDGFVAKYFLKLLPEVYTNPEVKIYEAPEGVPPLQNGKSVLVTSSKGVSDSDLLGSYILSVGGYNYTTMFESDPKILESDILVFSSDSNTTADINKLGLDHEKEIVILNSDGYGPFSRSIFESQGSGSINVQSGESVFVRSSTNDTLGSTSLREPFFGGSIEFTTYNEAQKIDYQPIIDDNQTSFWGSTGGIGIGRVSAPLLSNDPLAKMEGNDCLQIEIKEGNCSDWYIQHNYQVIQDWSTREFMTMWWYGVNSGQAIGILAAGLNWNNYFQYSFIDDSTGWRRLVIPLKGFTAHGEPRWDTIKTLQIRSLNGGIAGKWNLDSIGLEDKNNASVAVSIQNITPSELPKLSVSNGLSYLPMVMPPVNSTTKIPAENLYFLDGSRADRIFNESYAGEISLQEVNGEYIVTISLSIPPKSNELSQARFRVDYQKEQMRAKQVLTNDGEMHLPSEVEVVPMTPKEGVSVLGWYSDGSREVPLVTMQIVGGQTKVFYLNVYPLMASSFTWGNASEDLSKILAFLLDVVGLPKYDSAVPSWVIEDSAPVFAFEKGALTGNVSIQTDSILTDESNLSEVRVLVNNTQVSWRDVVSLSIQNFGGGVILFSNNVEIDSGKGFYTFISADDPEIKISGDKILISALTSNDTYLNVEGTGEAQLSTQGSLSGYVRTPNIHSFGEASFQKVYAFHSYLVQLNTMGQNLDIKGEIRLNLPLSDEYSVGSDFSWNGIATRDPPALTWDEVGSLRESIPYFVLATAIFFAGYSAMRVRKKRIVLRVRLRNTSRQSG